MSYAIEFRAVSKSFDNQTLSVDRLSFGITEGSIVALVGPSGCGKTTTLKMINRLVEPTDGEIIIRGEPAHRLPVLELRRSLGYVIQHHGLFPHMTIAENIAVVPRLLGWPKARIADRVEELLALVGLPAAQYARRHPRALSGGQQQRVGVARALAADPPILLMDEPFGALDPITRDRMQEELLSIQRKLGKTVVIVTHDMDEAVRLADHVAVLAAGRLVQYAPPADLLRAPADDFVAELLGRDRLAKLLKTLPVTSGMEPAAPPADAPAIAPDATLEEAFLLMLASGAAMLAVRGEAGEILGGLGWSGLLRARS